MSVDWTGYRPFEAGIDVPLRDVARELAESHFARLMAARPERRRQLADLWRRNGGGDLDADGATPFGAWLMTSLGNAGADALTGHEAVLWTGLVADVALWLGERIIQAAAEREASGLAPPLLGAPGAAGPVRWSLLVAPKKATGYQRPVLIGFFRVPDPRYYVDVAHLVASWADLAARRRPNVRPDFLTTIMRTTLADA